jgi:hypothetical protein
MTMIGYANADLYLAGGRNKDDRPIGDLGASQAIRNTRLVRRGKDIAIRYHETDIITLHPDGSRTLDTGGWLTMGTKRRLNAYLDSGWGTSRLRITSDRGRWFLSRGWDVKVCRYFDGITIAADGSIVNPPSEAKEQAMTNAEAKMGKRIDTYIDAYFTAMERGAVPLPSGGDCWDCAFIVTDGPDKGKPIGDVKGDGVHGHLWMHIKDRYYVPTLLWNAVKARGYRDVNFIMASRLDRIAWEAGQMEVRRAWGSTTEPDAGCRKELRRELRKYMRTHLIPTVAHQ